MKSIFLVAVCVLLLSTGCSGGGGSSNASGGIAGIAPPTAPTQSACEFSALAQPGQVFTFLDAPAAVASYTRCSRFALYDTGGFELQFGHGAAYSGTYRVWDGLVDFKWDGTSAAGSWGSDATLEGDTLRVHYNAIMQLTDFEDAVYRRSN